MLCAGAGANVKLTVVTGAIPRGHQRFGIALGVMGALGDCLARARTYSLERRQFKRPLASFQLVQKKLVDAQTEVSLGLLAALQVRLSSLSG